MLLAVPWRSKHRFDVGIAPVAPGDDPRAALQAIGEEALDMVAGGGLVAAMSNKHHLDFLDIVRHVHSERRRHHHGIREAELSYGLRLCHSLLTGDDMYGAAGL